MCLGDSIFGMERGATSIPNIIANISGATVYNCCLGGTRATAHNYAEWACYDFVELTNSIVNGNFTTQINNLSANGMGIPSYFADVITQLQNIDFNSVDIVIINYGGNDYTAGCYIENGSNVYDVSTYLGALRTGIETLLNVYQNLRIEALMKYR